MRPEAEGGSKKLSLKTTFVEQRGGKAKPFEMDLWFVETSYTLGIRTTLFFSYATERIIPFTNHCEIRVILFLLFTPF